MTGSDLETDVQWAVFWGGEDPADCAGFSGVHTEAGARAWVQWITGGGIARRTVAYGPWEVMPAEPADGQVFDSEDVPTCIRCGCTDERACPGGCMWVPGPMEGDLCSRCASAEDGDAAAETAAILADPDTMTAIAEGESDLEAQS